MISPASLGVSNNPANSLPSRLAVDSSPRSCPIKSEFLPIEWVHRFTDKKLQQRARMGAESCERC